MNKLIIQLPPQPRFASDAALPAAASGGMAVDDGPATYAYVLTTNGQTVTRQGRGAIEDLPRAETVVLLLCPADVSWHRLVLPKAPASRLRQALAGLLEEQLLVDPEEVHLAVAPGAKVGEAAWVAACHHTWLTSHLMAFEKAGLRVHRVVPAVWPDAPPTAYFQEMPGMSAPAEGQAPELMLTWSTPDGVASWPLSGSMSRALLPEPLPAGARFYATPPAAAPAERWLGHAVQARAPADHALMASRSMWNVLQFDLRPSSQGLQALTDRWRKFMGPSWRPVRVGLVVLLATQLVGLNVWAWQQQRTLKAKRAEMTTLLKAAHPQVQVVLDPAVQMRRETDALRAASGQPGTTDLEFLMRAVASAWQGDHAAKGFVYDGISLDVGVPDFWSLTEVDAFASRLRSNGLQVEQQGSQLRVSAARTGA